MLVTNSSSLDDLDSNMSLILNELLFVVFHGVVVCIKSAVA